MKYFLAIILTSLITFFGIAVIFFSSTNFTIGEQINFETKDGQFRFTAVPSKGRDYKMMERQFEKYKVKNNLDKDLKIFRTTRINYLNINKWCYYKGMPEWHYPYLQ